MEGNKTIDITTQIPEGYEIDVDKSTIYNIVLKPKPAAWYVENEEYCKKNNKHYYLGTYDRDNLAVVKCANTAWRPSQYKIPNIELAVILSIKATLMQEMTVFAHLRNDGWVANWNDKQQTKWGIESTSNRDIVVNYWKQTNPFIFGIAVKSVEIAKEMLEIFGDRVKTIFYK